VLSKVNNIANRSIRLSLVFKPNILPVCDENSLFIITIPSNYRLFLSSLKLV